MKNIYCRNSKLSSWCVKILLERYAEGDTASETKQFIEGIPVLDKKGRAVRSDAGDICWKIEPHLEPTHDIVDEWFREYLLQEPTYVEMANFANYRTVMYPSYFRYIKISRQTVNRYFLLFGKYLWEKNVAPILSYDARRILSLSRKIHPNAPFGTLDDDANRFIKRIVKKRVRQANGMLVKKNNVKNIKEMLFLIERAKKFNGLKLEYSCEHYSWACLVEEITKRGYTRKMLGAILSTYLINSPL